MIKFKCGCRNPRCKGCECHRRKPTPKGNGGLLKFSGSARGVGEIAVITSYLGDSGMDIGPSGPTPTSYPFALERRIQNLSVNLPDKITNQLGSVRVEVLKNGVPVPGFFVDYGGSNPMVGIQTAVAGPVTFAIGDVLDVVARVADSTHNISATIGLV